MITSKNYKMTIMNHIEDMDHDQILMLSLDQTVDGKNMLRMIDTSVEILDLSLFELKCHEPQSIRQTTLASFSNDETLLVWVSKQHSIELKIRKRI